jgi:DNA sulfur modification protein DndD
LHNYLPKAGHQVIILSTDAEIVGELENIIDRYVAKKYLLEYDETTKATKITEGYFGRTV